MYKWQDMQYTIPARIELNKSNLQLFMVYLNKLILRENIHLSASAGEAHTEPIPGSLGHKPDRTPGGNLKISLINLVGGRAHDSRRTCKLPTHTAEVGCDPQSYRCEATVPSTKYIISP